MNLPVDLIHGEPAMGSRDTGGYAKDLQKVYRKLGAQ